MATARSRRWSAVRRIACLALAATLLSGCVIVPEHHWHPWGHYR